jgi:D-methionine transport system substrate-binding protein
MNIKKHLAVAVTVAVTLPAVLFGADKKVLTFGVAPGPYGDIVKQAIAPTLEKKGYTIDIKEFSDYVQPNIALANKSIDVNVYQHRVYLEKFAADKKIVIAPVITIPTAALGIYSRKFKSIAAIADGATVTIANDPSNLARALRYLQSLGLITISPNIDATKASEKDVLENPRHLKIQPVEAAQLPRTVDSVDVSVVNGNYAISAGIYPQAIAREKLEEKYLIVIAVRSEDLADSFTRDIKEAVASKSFENAIYDPKNIFKDFALPEWLIAKHKSK